MRSASVHPRSSVERHEPVREAAQRNPDGFARLARERPSGQAHRVDGDQKIDKRSHGQVLNGTPRGGASRAGRSACSQRRVEVAERPTDVQILEVLTQRRDLSSRPRQLQVYEGCFVGVGSALYRWAVFLALIGVLRPHTFLTVASSKLVVTENVIVGVLAIAFLVPLATGTYDLARGRSMSMAPDAARLAGVRTDRLVWASLVASTVIAGSPD